MKLQEYLIIDGYNIINNWTELKRESLYSLDSARKKLIDIMLNYQSFSGNKIIIVFDAHYVKNSMEKHEMHNGIEIVYTKEFESADNYIERFVRENIKKSIIKVATSDYLEQRLVIGLGGARISARELKEEIKKAKKKLDKDYISTMKHERNLLEHQLNSKIFNKLERLRRQTDKDHIK